MDYKVPSGELPVAYTMEAEGNVSLFCSVLPMCYDYGNTLEEGLFYLQSLIYDYFTDKGADYFWNDYNPQLIGNYSLLSLPIEFEAESTETELLS
jgi:hypothetical protein